MTYFDYRWQGAPRDMEAALAGQVNVIGPRLLDGIAYAAVRSEAPLEMPAGLSEIGPSLAAVLLGTWAGQDVEIPAPAALKG